MVWVSLLLNSGLGKIEVSIRIQLAKDAHVASFLAFQSNTRCLTFKASRTVFIFGCANS